MKEISSFKKYWRDVAKANNCWGKNPAKNIDGFNVEFYWRKEGIRTYDYTMLEEFTIKGGDVNPYKLPKCMEIADIRIFSASEYDKIVLANYNIKASDFYDYNDRILVVIYDEKYKPTK